MSCDPQDKRLDEIEAGLAAKDKKMKKESLDSIRALIQQELKNL